MSESEPTNAADEAAQIKALQKDARAVVKPLETLLSLKANDAAALDAIDKLIVSIPTGERFAAAVDEIRNRATALVAQARAGRSEQIRKIEADYVRARRAEGAVVKESGEGKWRIGRVELELDRPKARARVSYNHEQIVGWSPIATPPDLDSLLDKAEKLWTAAEIPSDTLCRAFHDAYEHLKRTIGRGEGQSLRVPIKQFYPELRVALARQELTNGADKKLVRTELPKWAFLLNLDCYRRDTSMHDAQQRLSLETGSQHDHQKGLAVIGNGLDAREHYRSYCYIFRPSTS